MSLVLEHVAEAERRQKPPERRVAGLLGREPGDLLFREQRDGLERLLHQHAGITGEQREPVDCLAGARRRLGAVGDEATRSVPGTQLLADERPVERRDAAGPARRPQVGVTVEVVVAVAQVGLVLPLRDAQQAVDLATCRGGTDRAPP